MNSTVLVSGSPLADHAASQIESLGCTVVRGPRVADWSHELVLPRHQWAEVLPTVDVIVTTPHDSCPAALLDETPKLRGVVSMVIGVETIAVEHAHQRGVVVANGAVEENYLGLAEATVALLATSLLRIPTKARILHEGGGPPADRMLGTMIRGKTVGLIGLGRTARAVVERLVGWDVQLAAYDPYVDPTSVPSGVKLLTLPELLAASDVVSVHVTLSSETHHLLGEEELATMQPHAYLINTARGGVIDEQALTKALQSGNIAGAALDVFEQEPLATNSPLRQLSDVILTPHMAGHTQELITALSAAARENVARILQGERPLHTVTPAEVIARWQNNWAPETHSSLTEDSETGGLHG